MRSAALLVFRKDEIGLVGHREVRLRIQPGIDRLLGRLVKQEFGLVSADTQF